MAVGVLCRGETESGFFILRDGKTGFFVGAGSVGAVVGSRSRFCVSFVVFSLPSGCRSHPLGVLLAIRARKFRRTGNTGCREAPPARRKGSSLLLPSQLQLSSAERHPRATAGIGNRSNNRELFDRFPPARGQRLFLARQAHAKRSFARPAGGPAGAFAVVFSV